MWIGGVLDDVLDVMDVMDVRLWSAFGNGYALGGNGGW